MDMEFCLDGNVLTAKERNMLIRYCVSVATRGKCSTLSLLRPFRQKDLRAAAKEQRQSHLARIEELQNRAEEYDPETSELPKQMTDFFGGKPSKERYAAYCRDIVKQERDILRMMKRMYSVGVNYAFVGREWLAFHLSLDPRVTFGYSSCLHEECDFSFDEGKREAFLRSSLAELPQRKGDEVHDWGRVMFGRMKLFYEDLTLFRGETCILETVSHEEMMTVRLGDPDLSALARHQGGKRLADKLRKTLE